MNGNPRDIRELSLPEIESFFETNKEKKFRARQVYDWLWVKSCSSFDEMTNLPGGIRKLLSGSFSFPVLSVSVEKRSSDGTIKNLFRLADDLKIEGVLIPSADRTTACISSQAGCPLGCIFCATGSSGFKRNLSFTEIFDQVVLLNRLSLKEKGVPLSNIVYMGMGEPLLNYDQVLRSVERITSPEAMGMSPQRITVSTVGIPGMIRRLADDDVRFQLAVSLHAATDIKRNRIVPVNRKYPLADLIDALKYFHEKSGKRITIEYILFKNFNDGIADARDLAVFCRNFPVKVNLIEYNPVKGSPFEGPDPVRTTAFRDFLETKNMVVNIRKSRGKDIDAACGQLAAKKDDL